MDKYINERPYGIGGEVTVVEDNPLYPLHKRISELENRLAEVEKALSKIIIEDVLTKRAGTQLA